MPIEIRKLNRKDEDALIEICFVTGESFLKKTLPDPYLFSLFWCLYYAWYDAENCFVAVDTKTNTTIGYILSTLDTRNQEENFKKKLGPQIKSQMKKLRIKSLKSRLIAHFIINKPTNKKRKKLLEKFPAHLHINILPDYQRQGIGYRLMKTLESHFKENNVIGYHLEVSAKNKLGINFYKKYGLELVSKNRFSLIFAKKFTKSCD